MRANKAILVDAQETAKQSWTVYFDLEDSGSYVVQDGQLFREEPGGTYTPVGKVPKGSKNFCFAPIDNSCRAAVKTLHFTSRRERLWFGSGTKMGDQILEPFPGREMCNFCSERPTTQLYACKNFLIPRTKTALFQHESIGAWAACHACAELVDGGRWSELTDRALTNFIKQHGVPRYAQLDVREQFREIHQLFREHLVKES